jgi:hypothetical protein
LARSCIMASRAMIAGVKKVFAIGFHLILSVGP